MFLFLSGFLFVSGHKKKTLFCFLFIRFLAFQRLVILSVIRLKQRHWFL